MTYFWCEKHKAAHLKGDDSKQCLLVGPFSTKAAAKSWDREVRKETKRLIGSRTDRGNAR